MSKGETQMNKCAYCNLEALRFARLFFTDTYVYLCGEHTGWGADS